MTKTKTGHYRNNREESRRKEAAVERKREKVRGLSELLQEWEAFELAASANSDAMHNYILKLRSKLRNAKNQLLAMGGVKE